MSHQKYLVLLPRTALANVPMFCYKYLVFLQLAQLETSQVTSLKKSVFLPVTQLEKCLSISAEISGGSFCHLHTLKMPRQNDLGLLQTRLENVLTPRQNVPMSRQKHFVLLTTSDHVPVGLPV